MPERKNPYKPFLCLEGLPCDEIGKAYEEGQQNPDPKQYAKREELVDAILKKRILKWDELPIAHEVLDIIRTHGLRGEMGNECEVCGKESIVKLNGVSLCQECYDKKLAKIVEIVNRNPGPLGMVQLPRED